MYTTFTNPRKLVICLDFCCQATAPLILFFYSSFLRPLPSLESPQVEFVTPTEEIPSALISDKVILPPEEAEENAAQSSCPSAVKRPDDLPKPLEKVDLPEPIKYLADLTSKAELPGESSKTKPLEQESSQKLFDRKSVLEATEHTKVLKPAQKTEEILARNEVEVRETPNLEDLQPNEPRTETLQLQQQQLLEEPEEKPIEVPPVEPFRVPVEKTEVPETVEHPFTELQNSG